MTITTVTNLCITLSMIWFGLVRQMHEPGPTQPMHRIPRHYSVAEARVEPGPWRPLPGTLHGLCLGSSNIVSLQLSVSLLQHGQVVLEIVSELLVTMPGENRHGKNHSSNIHRLPTKMVVNPRAQYFHTSPSLTQHYITHYVTGAHIDIVLPGVFADMLHDPYLSRYVTLSNRVNVSLNISLQTQQKKMKLSLCEPVALYRLLSSVLGQMSHMGLNPNATQHTQQLVRMVHYDGTLPRGVGLGGGSGTDYPGPKVEGGPAKSLKLTFF